VKRSLLIFVLTIPAALAAWPRLASPAGEKIVPDGEYMGVQANPTLSQTDPGNTWFHERTLIVRNDQAVLDSVPYFVHQGKKEYSASDGGFMTFRGRFAMQEGKPVIEIRMCGSEYVVFPTGFVPYREVKTYPVRIAPGRIEFDGVRYHPKILTTSRRDELLPVLNMEPVEKDTAPAQ
jgi:hypothetical protein